MGINRITAYIIATRDDIICTSAGPADNGKYLGWITLGPEDRCRPLLNSEPVFDSHELAVAAMKKTVEELKEIVEKETGGKHPIDHVFDQVEKAIQGS